MAKSKIISISIVLFSFITALVVYDYMPNIMDGHWNAQGIMDGQISKFWGIFSIPVINFFILLLFLIIPRIDPLKENIEKFRKYFDFFLIVTLFFLNYIYILTLIWNLGYEFNMIQAMMPGFAILWYICGVLIKNTERNWFVGIRTPWTLTNDQVWRKTHDLAGIAFKISALLVVVGMVFDSIAILFIVIPPIVFMSSLMFYSYFIYRRINQFKK